jgi:hypothetical protein
MMISGLNHTAFDLAVNASQWRSPATTQDSLPAAGPALPDGIAYPQGSDEKFHITILLSRVSWRNVSSFFDQKNELTPLSLYPSPFDQKNELTPLSLRPEK